MVGHVYYVIRPSDALAGIVAKVGSQGGEVLLEPQLWHCPEHDRSRLRPADYLRRIKSAYLARMASMLQSDPAIAVLELSPQLSEADFDRWWCVERFDGIDEELSDVERELGLTDPPSNT